MFSKIKAWWNWVAKFFTKKNLADSHDNSQISETKIHGSSQMGENNLIAGSINDSTINLGIQSSKANNPLIKRVIEDLDHNISPGVGGERVPFRLDYLKKLRECDDLNSELMHDIVDLINSAEKCDGRYSPIVPGMVKSKSEIL